MKLKVDALKLDALMEQLLEHDGLPLSIDELESLQGLQYHEDGMEDIMIGQVNNWLLSLLDKTNNTNKKTLDVLNDQVPPEKIKKYIRIALVLARNFDLTNDNETSTFELSNVVIDHICAHLNELNENRLINQADVLKTIDSVFGEKIPEFVNKLAQSLILPTNINIKPLNHSPAISAYGGKKKTSTIRR